MFTDNIDIDIRVGTIYIPIIKYTNLMYFLYVDQMNLNII